MNALAFPADFAVLDLELDPLNGRLLYRADALRAACVANAIDPATVLGDEDRACSMIAGWYLAHRERGGTPDDVAELILSRLDPRATH